MPGPRPDYRGRFAPSPTGPLHLGSLLAAVASFLDARAAGGAWLLRMEDIDPPREVPGAAGQIIAALRSHGLHWDGDILWQSTRHDAYRHALAELRCHGLVFDCCCTRAQLGPGGSCGERCSPGPDDACSVRLRLNAAAAGFDDIFLGPIPAGATPRDVVLWRKDGLPAYQLAVTVDDHWQQVNTVVRGADLLEQTPVQRYLFDCLGAPAPRYGHVPVLCDADGRKLSKQNGAAAVDDLRPVHNLRRVLRLLRQPAADAAAADAEALLAAAAEDWRPARFTDLGRELSYAGP